MVKKKLEEKINYNYKKPHWTKSGKKVVTHRDLKGRFISAARYEKERIEANTYNVAIRKARRTFKKDEVEERKFRKLFNEVSKDIDASFKHSMTKGKKVKRDKISGRITDVKGKKRLATLANIRETAKLREEYRKKKLTALSVKERNHYRDLQQDLADFNYILVEEYGSG